MTGAQHFDEAMRLITPLESVDGQRTYRPTDGAVAAAQVHATLALAAATREATVYAHGLENKGYGA